jgi:hypothetical protein
MNLEAPPQPVGTVFNVDVHPDQPSMLVCAVACGPLQTQFLWPVAQAQKLVDVIQQAMAKGRKDEPRVILAGRIQ